MSTPTSSTNRNWNSPRVPLSIKIRLAIREARLRQGFTYKSLARDMGVSNTTPAYWENGGYKSISYFNWLKLCNLLKLDSKLISKPKSLDAEDVKRMKRTLPSSKQERIVNLLQAINHIDNSQRGGVLNAKQALDLKENIINEHLGKIFPNKHDAE